MNAQNIIPEVKEQLARYDARARAWTEAFTARGGRIYCAAGCFRCCDMPIRVSFAEALTMAEVMTGAQHEAMRAHAEKVWENAHLSRSEDEYVHNHRQRVGFCPLLDRESGKCTQYESRPARCRDTHSGLPARFCAPDGLEKLTREERRRYEREVRTNPAMDGFSHFIAPLEDLSLPAWNKFGELMRRELGFEVWGDFAYLVTMTREPEFLAALELRDKRRVIAALKKAKLYHPEIVQIE